MLTERDVKILKILVDTNDNISITRLADIFKLSERSIRYDIEKINKVLKSKALPLIKKVSVGNLALKSKDRVKHYINSLDTLYYSSESRQKFILYKVALTGSVNLTTISKVLNVSRTSIKKDVEEVKETLYTFNLKLIQCHNKGLIIDGEENDIRRLQLALLTRQLSKTKINELLIKPLVDSYLKGVNTTKIDEFINIIETQTSNIISDQAFNILKTYIIITIKRIKGGKTLITHQDDEHIFLFTPEFETINNHLSILEMTFDIEFNNDEIIKITDLFISSPSYNFPEGFYNYWYEIEIFVNNLVHEFSQDYNLDLTDDKELIKDLITYMKPILYNNKKRIEENDSTNAHIIELYPGIHQIIVNILNKNNSNLIHLNRNDILALTIYFIASVERNKYKIKTKKNILIVCGIGYGTSKLIELQLKQKYNINIVDTIPFHYVKNYTKMDEVDLVITTYENKFNKVDKPIIIVKPYLTSENFRVLDSYNLQKLERQIPLSKLINIFKSNYNDKEKSKLLELLKTSMGELIIDDLTPPNDSLLDFLPLENIYVNVELDGWKEAMSYAGDLLNEKGYVTSSYKDSLIDAFKKYGSYMLISKDIAIPHARNNNNILKTGMVLITLKNKVITPSGKDLKVILAFTSADNLEHLDALSEFSDLLVNSQFREIASEAETSRKILDFIKANIEHN